MTANLEKYFQTVDSLADTFIDRLRKAVAIPSISAEDARRPDTIKACVPYSSVHLHLTPNRWANGSLPNSVH